MRAVIDVNVLVSGLLWHGPPHTLIERVRDGRLRLISSPALLAELVEVLVRPEFDDILKRSNTSLERALAEIQTLAEVIAAPPVQRPLCRDPDDDEVLALAVAGRADLIISGRAGLGVSVAAHGCARPREQPAEPPTRYHDALP